MRNAVIMMTANTTEDVVADSPPSAPSGRFGGLVWSRRGKRPPPTKRPPTTPLCAHMGQVPPKAFPPQSDPLPVNHWIRTRHPC